MQAQRTQAQVGINAAQSLLVVRTLLEAGLGCIAYLRNLLPDDHFEDCGLTSTNNESFSMDQGGSDMPAVKSSFKIKTLKRGCSEEADKLLDHLQRGIFDALEKRYLRRFILGIHLDDSDPNNIVETYAFDFKYCSIPGVATPVPIISLGEALDGISLDPAMKSMKQGQLPSVADVKKSLKSLLRRLISSVNHMDELPQRRFATFKLLYTEDTPADYEPPTFMSGDVEKNRWFFTTHGGDEPPDDWRIGGIDTGHHAVKMTIRSVTSSLPASSLNDQIFTGIAPSVGIPGKHTAVRDSIAYEKDDRQHVWNIDELSDTDAEGDEDPDFIISTQSNDCQPIDSQVGFSQESQAPYFTGSVEAVPRNVADIGTRRSAVILHEELPATQLMDISALPTDETARMPSSDYTAPVPLYGEPMDVDRDCSGKYPSGPLSLPDATSSIYHTRSSGQAVLPSTGESLDDESIDCECQIKEEGCDCILCDGGCARWFHTWCMGYHSREDPSLPDVFICFDCRLKSDPLWTVFRGDLYQNLLIKFRDLAQFRRAIKMAETTKSFNSQKFVKEMGCNSNTGKSLIDRLEEEGFIASQVTVVDDIGVTSVTQKGKAKKGQSKKASRGRANLQKTPYAFVQKCAQGKAYQNYFTPTEQVENHLVGLEQMKARLTAKLPHPESQTQDETQYPFQAYDGELNQRHLELPQDESRPTKRLKVSVTSAVDLAE